MTLSTGVQIVIGVGTGIVAIIAVFSNLLVYVAFCCERRLRTYCNYYIVSLATADLLVGVIVIPLFAYPIIVGEWDFPPHVGVILCNIWMCSDVWLCTASILNLCAISIDRYRAIIIPINYATKRTRLQTIAIILIIWAVSLIIALSPLVAYRDVHARNVKENRICALTSDFKYVVPSSFISFYIPCAITIGLYFRIIKEMTKRSRSMKRNVKANAQSLPKSTKKKKKQKSSGKASDKETDNSDRPRTRKQGLNFQYQLAVDSRQTNYLQIPVVIDVAQPSSSDSNTASGNTASTSDTVSDFDGPLGLPRLSIQRDPSSICVQGIQIEPGSRKPSVQRDRGSFCVPSSNSFVVPVIETESPSGSAEPSSEKDTSFFVPAIINDSDCLTVPHIKDELGPLRVQVIDADDRRRSSHFIQVIEDDDPTSLCLPAIELEEPSSVYEPEIEDEEPSYFLPSGIEKDGSSSLGLPVIQDEEPSSLYLPVIENDEPSSLYLPGIENDEPSSLFVPEVENDPSSTGICSIQNDPNSSNISSTGDFYMADTEGTLSDKKSKKKTMRRARLGIGGLINTDVSSGKKADTSPCRRKIKQSRPKKGVLKKFRNQPRKIIVSACGDNTVVTSVQMNVRTRSPSPNLSSLTVPVVNEYCGTGVRQGRRRLSSATLLPAPSGPLMSDNRAGRIKRISRATVKRRLSVARERRAAKTLGIVMCVFCICWTPFFVINVLNATCCPVDSPVFMSVAWVAYVNSAVNPLLYTCFNPTFKAAFKKILCAFRKVEA